jgi:outer membrane lipoprotein-sorting protein
MVHAGKRIALFCLGLVVSLPGSLSAQSAPPAGSADLQKIITELNAAAAKFVSAQADFAWDQFTAVVEDHEIQTGTIYFERKKSVTYMALDIKQDNGKDAPKTVVYDGTVVKFYQPLINQLTTMKAGANRGQFESFLTLGFGGSGADLEKNWKVNLLGVENMDGVSVAKLDLVPKEQKVQDMFTHVTIWVEPSRGINHKQIFYQASGDLRTTTYKNIRYNSPVPADVFQIKPAPGTNFVEK